MKLVGIGYNNSDMLLNAKVHVLNQDEEKADIGLKLLLGHT